MLTTTKIIHIWGNLLLKCTSIKIKNTFIVPTDAQYYKILEILNKI